MHIHKHDKVKNNDNKMNFLISTSVKVIIPQCRNTLLHVEVKMSKSTKVLGSKYAQSTWSKNTNFRLILYYWIIIIVALMWSSL